MLDLDLLVAARERTDVQVNLSIGTLDTDVWRATEPGTPHPARRLEAVAALNEAGIRAGCSSRRSCPACPTAASSSRRWPPRASRPAVSVSAILLHLRPGVKQHYLETLRASHPDVAAAAERLYPRANAPKASQRRLRDRARSRAPGRRVQRRPEPSAHLTGHEHPTPVPEPARRPRPPRQLGLDL